MLNEYAIDPNELARLGPMWVLMEQMGIAKGRVVAEFPDKWLRMVHDASRAASCPDVERKTIEERLIRHKKTTLAKLTPNRQYVHDNWLESALSAHAESPFRAILTDKDLSGDGVCLRPVDATEDNSLWKASMPPVPKTADALAECCGPLGRISHDLLFVDPYLDGDPRRLSVVREILRASGLASGREFRRIELHVSEKAGDIRCLSKEVKVRVLSEFPSETKLRILKWEKKSVGDKMHPRYFLTERGGIRIDCGFIEGNPGETTDVQLLEDAMYQARWADYQKTTPAFDLACESLVCRLA